MTAAPGDDDDDALEPLLHGPPSTTVVSLKTLDDTEVARLVFPGDFRDVPNGYNSESERVKTHVRRIEYVVFDEYGIETDSSITCIDAYGRALPSHS